MLHLLPLGFILVRRIGGVGCGFGGGESGDGISRGCTLGFRCAYITQAGASDNVRSHYSQADSMNSQLYAPQQE